MLSIYQEDDNQSEWSLGKIIVISLDHQLLLKYYVVSEYRVKLVYLNKKGFYHSPERILEVYGSSSMNI